MPRVNVTFTEKEYNHIEEVVKKGGATTASDYVRKMYYEGKKVYNANENIDFIVDIIEDRMRSILAPNIERLASISAKGAIMSATSTFLNAQAIADFIPLERRKDFVEVYEKARLKGIAYVKNRINDDEQIKKDIKAEYEEK